MQALAEASEGSEDDQSVFRSCYALLLFAVPNRGLENSSLIYMVKGQPNEDLVKDLKPSSRFLNMLSQRFNKYFTLDGSKIISIYETKTTPTVKVCYYLALHFITLNILTFLQSGAQRLHHGKGPVLKL